MYSTEKFEILKSIMMSNRSIRRFDRSFKITETLLNVLVGLTRYCASGRNLQPMRYRTVVSESECSEVFPLLSWAGYYKDWAGPSEEERPRAYLVQCLDRELTDNPLCDDGIQLEAITLAAASLGLGCCIIKAFNPDRLKEVLGLPDSIEPRYVIAVGRPAEKARITDLPSDGDYKYFRDKDDTQCVPKRPLNALLIK